MARFIEGSDCSRSANARHPAVLAERIIFYFEIRSGSHFARGWIELFHTHLLKEPAVVDFLDGDDFKSFYELGAQLYPSISINAPEFRSTQSMTAEYCESCEGACSSIFQQRRERTDSSPTTRASGQ